MTVELSTRYDPAEIEQKVYEFWEEGRCFHSEPDEPGETYTIVIPPPNVTDVLHIGHALNNTIQDILVRWRRMQGYNTLWLPGTDHAGIATQNRVEQHIAEDGLKRWDIGREKFLERVWEWREKYGGKIINQLKRLGCSCDWERERFTMDEGLSEAVMETFEQLYDRGLIYRGKYIINWCPRCGTALADDEVEHEDHEGHLWHIKYPLKEDRSRSVIVATTRPETMLGDTAVAVHPEDERYQEYIGKTLVLPIVGREIPVIADDWVDPEFGTGAVKVTPAHDPDDFELGLRHDLERVMVIDEDANMTHEAGTKYEDMDRYECRETLVEDLREREELAKVEPYEHSVGHCYRCHTVVEPYLSDQWFVKMKPLAKKAAAAARDGRVEFHPARWKDFYLSWLDNVRDWCISRQIWWGHRLPVYYCERCDGIAVGREEPEACPDCGSNELVQDEDVLDTWFSSALWPFSTLGWPEETEDLTTYYPTDTLVTARDILYFWVARMVMMGLEFMDEVPFSDVYIHGTILDELGRKMSKSLGNGIDPIEMIEQYGADAVRLSLIMLTAEGQDIKLSESKFQMGRNFANKVWNATRFVLMNLEDGSTEDAPEPSKRRFEDRWILSRLVNVAESVTDSLERFKLNEAAHTFYQFFWHEYCDWYVEMTKSRLNEDADPEAAAAARATLQTVLDASLRLMHPFAPFISEELWQKLKDMQDLEEDALISAAWPEPDSELRDETLEEQMSLLQELIRGVRHIRKEKSIEEDQPISLIASCSDQETADVIDSRRELLSDVASLGDLEVGVNLERPPKCATSVVSTVDLYVKLEGLIDLEQEVERLEKQKADVEDYLGIVKNKLENPDFCANAPEEVVQKEIDKEKDLKEQLRKINENLAELTDGE